MLYLSSADASCQTYVCMTISCGVNLKNIIIPDQVHPMRFMDIIIVTIGCPEQKKRKKEWGSYTTCSC